MNVVVAFEAWWAVQLAWLRTYLSDDALVVTLGFVSMLVTYYAVSFALLVTDARRWPRWLAARRVQPARPFAFGRTRYNPAFGTLLANVLVNQLFVILPALAALQAVSCAAGFGVRVSATLPTWREVVLYQLPLTLLAVETLFYWSHRWLHHPAVYKYVHKVHHEYKAPHAFAAIYAHPFEALLGNTICVIGPAFFLDYHVLSFMLGMTIGWVQTCLGHSGYFLPGDKHDKHHELFDVCYGTYGLWDWIMGTDLKTFMAKRKARKARD